MSVAHQPIPEKKRSGIDGWLDERLHTGKAIGFVLNHPIPLRVHPMDYLGEVTLFVFISQFVTGMLLAMAYHPVAQTPYYYCDPQHLAANWQHYCPAKGTVSPSEAW